jgi:hypothetical protein
MVKKYVLLVIMGVIGIAGCSNLSDSTAVFENTIQDDGSQLFSSSYVTTVPENPGEIVRVNGISGEVSEPFSIEEHGTVRIHWDQASEGIFMLEINNLDPELAGTRFGSVAFEFVIGPSSGVKAYTYIPGKYVIEVEADNAWEVWLENSDNVFTNIAGAGELARVSANSPGISEAFILNHDSVLRVSWAQSGQGRFQFVLQSQDLENIDLLMGPPVIEDVVGPSEGVRDIILVQGVYAIDVQFADGLWEIGVGIIETVGEE